MNAIHRLALIDQSAHWLALLPSVHVERHAQVRARGIEDRISEASAGARPELVGGISPEDSRAMGVRRRSCSVEPAFDHSTVDAHRQDAAVVCVQ